MKTYQYIGVFCLAGFILASCASSKPTAAFKAEKEEEVKQAFESAFSEGVKQHILGNYNEARALFEKAASLKPDNGGVNYMLARLAYMFKEDSKAVSYVQKAIKSDPKNRHYYDLAATLYQAKGDYDNAIKVYKRMLVEFPENEDYYLGLADLYVRKRNFEEAIAQLDKLEQLTGRSPETTRKKQELYMRLGKPDKAIQEGQELINAYPDDLDMKVFQAEFLYLNRREEESMKMLNDVIEKDPNNPQSHLILSDIYTMRKEYDKAFKELEIVFTHPGTSLDTKLNLLEGYLRGEQTDRTRSEGLKLAELAVTTHPDEARAYAAYGDALLMNGKKEEAWKQYLKAKDLDGTNSNLWIQLLQLDSDLNKTDSLIRHSEQALENFPNVAQFWMYNGTAWSQKKDYSKAAEAFEEGRKLSAGNPELKSYFNLYLGDTYNNLKEYEKSDAAYEEVLKFDRNNDHVLNNYSYFLSLRKERLDYAKEMSERVVKRNPNNPTYLDTYAWVLYVMKDYEGARKYLEIAVANSTNGTIYEHYGDALFQLGQVDKAVEYWKKAKALGETTEWIDKKIADRKLYE